MAPAPGRSIHLRDPVPPQGPGSALKTQIANLLADAVRAAVAAGELALTGEPAIVVERARREGHGDFASPLALSLARAARAKPRDVAETLVQHLPDSATVDRAEIAGPGFINFHLAPHAFQAVVAEVLEKGEAYGRVETGAGRRVQVEFVSANPTGPLHVGHGRGAAYGAAVANLLAAAGWNVQREYYVNDAGRQMAILALSTWLRYPSRPTPTEAATSATGRRRCARSTARSCAWAARTWPRDCPPTSRTAATRRSSSTPWSSAPASCSGRIAGAPCSRPCAMCWPRSTAPS